MEATQMFNNRKMNKKQCYYHTMPYFTLNINDSYLHKTWIDIQC